VIRLRIKMRMKEALRLVVARGAYVDADGRILMRDEDIGETRWLLREWSYVFQPTLEMYKHPLDGIIDTVRSALHHIKERGSAQGLEWDVSTHFAEYPSGNEATIEEWLSRSEALDLDVSPLRFGQGLSHLGPPAAAPSFSPPRTPSSNMTKRRPEQYTTQRPRKGS